MKEIEIKILDINQAEIRKKLLTLGAAKVFDGDVDIINFDFPDERLRKAGQILRVRKLGNRIELTFKEKNTSKKFKSKEETEITASSFADTVKILEKLGFRRFYEGKKHRESYKLGNIRFEMDSYPTIPPYLEIEAPTEKDVETYVKKFGFTMKQATNLSAYELEEYYHKKYFEENDIYKVKKNYKEKLKRIQKQKGIRFATKEELISHLKKLR